MVEHLPTLMLARARGISLPLMGPNKHLRSEHGLGIGKLQIFGDDAAVLFRHFVGVDAPAAGRQLNKSGATFAWLSPNEWLLVGPEQDVAAWLASLDALGADALLAVDLSHARASFLLTGAGAGDVLAALCPLDLWTELFPVDAVARSLLGDASMFIARLADLADGPQWRIVVDQTMAGYAARMLAGPINHRGTQS